MIKTKNFVLLFSICMIGLFSCSKNSNTSTPTPGGAKSQKMSVISSTMSPGELHNLLIGYYSEQYGFQGNEGDTRDGILLVLNRVKGIANSLSITVNYDFVQATMADMDNMGWFNSDGTTKDITIINNLCAATEQNSDFRNVLMSINNFTYTGTEFINYAQPQLASLVLTGNALIRKEWFEDVLVHSDQIVETYGAKGINTKTQKEINARISAADAHGIIVGFNRAAFFGGNIYECQVAACLTAMAYSAAQASKEQW